MQHPTQNDISQRMHGAYNAVDYHSSPDPYVYAPERMTFYAYLRNAGDAGNNLQMTGAHGRHGFCHLEEIYVKPGQTVEQGERIAKMGYTGLTIPPGPEGRHLHWVLLTPDGYVYPPSLVTEAFNDPTVMKKGEVDMVTEKTAELLAGLAFFREGADRKDKTFIKSVVGQDINTVLEALLVSQERRKVQDAYVAGLKAKSGATLTDAQKKAIQAVKEAF